MPVMIAAPAFTHTGPSNDTSKKPQIPNEIRISKKRRCIRAILIESLASSFNTNKPDEAVSSPCLIGSVFIIPSTGGYIGNTASYTGKHVINLRQETGLDEFHVNVQFDKKQKCFFIQGLFKK